MYIFKAFFLYIHFNADAIPRRIIPVEIHSARQPRKKKSNDPLGKPPSAKSHLQSRFFLIHLSSAALTLGLTIAASGQPLLQSGRRRVDPRTLSLPIEKGDFLHELTRSHRVRSSSSSLSSCLLIGFPAPIISCILRVYRLSSHFFSLFSPVYLCYRRCIVIHTHRHSV